MHLVLLKAPRHERDEAIHHLPTMVHHQQDRSRGREAEAATHTFAGVAASSTHVNV
jgi:hypothetical protein